MVQLLRIVLENKLDLRGKTLIKKIQNQNQRKVDGIHELYDELYSLNNCISRSKGIIHYVAYTLADANIKFNILEENNYCE